MTGITTLPWQRRYSRFGRGSILLYVLWMLVVISILAFQLTMASKAMTLNQSAFAKQLKKQMQLASAIQFASYKIILDQWRDRTFSFRLNGEELVVSIFNEAGFVSVYGPQGDDATLARILAFAKLDESTAEELEKAFGDGKMPQRLNTFDELRQFAGIDRAALSKLIPLISIYHEEPANPMQAPAEVLMRFYRVDQYRVQKLMETTDPSERTQLRREIVNSLVRQDTELSEDLSIYYRVHIEIDGALYRVFLQKDSRQMKYRVVLIESSGSALDASRS